MEQKHLTQNFLMSHLPSWRCPSCVGGRLKVEGKLAMHDDAATDLISGEDWFEPENSHYVFAGLLKCGVCRESVIVSGDGFVEQDYGSDGIEHNRYLTPRFFYPPLKIIEPNVSENIPENITSCLEKAFQIFWCDAESCLNRLRTIAEYLLDDLKITRLGTKDSRLNLANRIALLVDPQYMQIKEALTSLRYMGNDGSHGSVNINRNELLSAFTVVNYCLEQIYPKIADNTQVLKFVSTVNQQKGFRKK